MCLRCTGWPTRKGRRLRLQHGDKSGAGDFPPRESLERFIPKDHLWPIDDVWNYHAGGERFTTVNIFTDGLNRRYGRTSSLDDYERKAQAMTYDGQRAMFEAYARNKYISTGVISGC